MTRSSSTAAAATAPPHLKLCAYDEEDPDIWFRLIGAQFAAAGVTSQHLMYANALASLPKPVLRDILDTVDRCNESDHPFDLLRETLLGQYGKSKWQSYFELLRLPLEMPGLKPSTLMGKLKQLLPPGVTPDNDLFLSMFLIRLPPSIREAVGAGHHMTAAAMVRAADALWDARGGPDPTVAAATVRHSRSKSPNGRKNGKKNGNSRSKSRPSSRPNFFDFQNPGNGMCKYHNFYGSNAHRCIAPCSFSEN